jgi:hypothetical protein
MVWTSLVILLKKGGLGMCLRMAETSILAGLSSLRWDSRFYFSWDDFFYFMEEDGFYLT